MWRNTLKHSLTFCIQRHNRSHEFLTQRSENRALTSPSSRVRDLVTNRPAGPNNKSDEEYLLWKAPNKKNKGIYAATPPATGLLERLFKLRQHGTTVRTELAAGLTTFITMAYIIFVNPNIMADAGIDHGAAFVATCLAAALGCFLMGLYANWPVGLAPGMGLNAFFTYTVVGTMGYSWQIALGAVFISGVMFMLLTFSRVREWLLNSIPAASGSPWARESACSSA